MEGKNCLVNALIIAQFTAKMEMVGRIPDYFPSGGRLDCFVVLLHFMRECALCILQETINYVVMQLLLGYHCAPCVIYDGMLPKTTCALTLSPPSPRPHQTSSTVNQTLTSNHIVLSCAQFLVLHPHGGRRCLGTRLPSALQNGAGQVTRGVYMRLASLVIIFKDARDSNLDLYHM